MNRGLRRGLIIAMVAALVVLVVAGLRVFYLLGTIEERGTGVAAVGGPFTLLDHHGATVTDEAFRGRLMLVFFGFTYCPDICPTELQTIAIALDELGPQAEQVQALFITIDPERDDPQAMAEYVESFHPRIVGLTGTAEQVAAAARAYRVYYAKAETGGGDYTMDHSSFIFLMDREGRYISHFSPPTSPERMADRIRRAL